MKKKLVFVSLIAGGLIGQISNAMQEGHRIVHMPTVRLENSVSAALFHPEGPDEVIHDSPRQEESDSESASGGSNSSSSKSSSSGDDLEDKKTLFDQRERDFDEEINLLQGLGYLDLAGTIQKSSGSENVSTSGSRSESEDSSDFPKLGSRQYADPSASSSALLAERAKNESDSFTLNCSLLQFLEDHRYLVFTVFVLTIIAAIKINLGRDAMTGHTEL
jgi:hypothetical protein